MTDQELIDYYADLLILQYRGKPKAYATIQALVKNVIMGQLPLAVQNAYDIETSVGVQLDVLGKYAGVERVGYAFNGDVINLDDDDFRQLIKLAVIKNSAGSSLYDIQILLQTFFPNQIYVYEIAKMQLNYFMSGGVGSQDLAQMFLLQDLFPRPMGVEIAALVYLLIIDNLFGYRTYTQAGNNVHGFNTYTSYDTDCHWLDYADTITI